MSAAKLLVEIGTEELPPKALRALMNAFGEALTAAIDDARLAHGATHVYASPRRLAVIIDELQSQQPDRDVEHKGPPVKVAFDQDGKPTAAALAFAKKCGVDVADLSREKTDKGEWLTFAAVERGQPVSELLPDAVESALGALPIPRRMRWGASDAEFVRPVHWIVMLHGADVIDATIMGVRSGNETRGFA